MEATPLLRLQAHPARGHLHGPILQAAGTIPTEVVLDPDPYGKPSPLRTYRLCVQPSPEHSHLVILQDDVRLCAEFDVALTRLLAHDPDRLIALFVGGAPRRSAHEMRLAHGRGKPLAELGRMDWVPTVALVWPMALAAEFSKHLGRVSHDMWADDPIVGSWASRKRIQMLATVPSLVEHEDVVRSLLPNDKSSGGKNGYRKAAIFDAGWSPVTARWLQD